MRALITQSYRVCILNKAEAASIFRELLIQSLRDLQISLPHCAEAVSAPPVEMKGSPFFTTPNARVHGKL